MRLKFLLALPSAALVAAFAPAADEYVAVKGQIKLAEVPKDVVIEVTADKAVCCAGGKDLISTRVMVDPKSKGLANVVVYLRPDTDKIGDPFPADKVHPDHAKPKNKKHSIDQPNCQFEPRLVAARDGDTLVIKNSSTIPHNINFKSDLLEFNVTVPAGKEHEVKDTLKADRRPALYKCDIHPWMEGRLFVFDHPYYAVTDKDGKFELKDVPAGKWRIVYRHEGGFHKGKDGALGFPIEVKADKKTMEMDAMDFELPK